MQRSTRRLAQRALQTLGLHAGSHGCLQAASILSMPLSSQAIGQPSVEAQVCRISHMVQMGTHLAGRHHAHAHAGGLQHSKIRSVAAA